MVSENPFSPLASAHQVLEGIDQSGSEDCVARQIGAAREAGELLKAAGSNVLFLGSATATVEDNEMLMRLASAVGAEAPRFIDRRGSQEGDDWLVSSDPAPNTAGCLRLGMAPVDPALLAGAVAACAHS